jgi:spermidine/putrescine transport system permease protein
VKPQSSRLHLKELNPLGWPPLFWFLFFLVGPVLIVTALSFLSRGTYGNIELVFQPENYLRVFEPVYLKIFLKSFELALTTSVICFCVGFPVAWAMATSSPSTRACLIVIMAVPFLTNLIIRVYALRIFLSIDGPVQAALGFLGVPFDPFTLSQNQGLVLYGMVTTYLPFMVFPLFAALEKLDFTLVEAAQDLGASSFKIMTNVLIPNTRPAIASGLILVFVPCLGEFVIPDLLGGARTMLVGNLITEQFLKARDWPFGAALSVTLVGLLVTLPYGIRRLVAGKAP